MANQGMYREGGALPGGLPFPRARIGALTGALFATAALAIVMSLALFAFIGHGPTGAWSLFRNGGWPMYLILLADFVAPILIAVLGLFVVRGKRLPTVVPFVIAAIPFLLALFGAWVGQTIVVGAISGESVDPEQKARILAEGFAESMSNDIFGGLVACGAAIVATLAATSSAASIDVALASKGERPKSIGPIGTAMFGGAWVLATIVIGILRLKSAGALALLPVLPLLAIVPCAVLAARGAVVVRGWHDRAEGSNVAGAIAVAGVSALLGVLALQRGIESRFTSQALEAIAGESIDPSQRLRILAYAVDAGRVAPASYAVHAVLGAATFGFALSPAIGGGKSPVTPSPILALFIGAILLGGAWKLGREREIVPRVFDQAAMGAAPKGVKLPSIVEALSDKRSGGGYGTSIVVTSDDKGIDPPPYAEATNFTIYADKAATLGVVRKKVPRLGASKVTFVATREHPPEIDKKLGYLSAYLGRVGYVSGTIDDSPTNAKSPETLRVVTIADDAVEIDGKRYAYPLPETVENASMGLRSKHVVLYVFRPTDTVERAIKTIATVERLREYQIVTWDLSRTIVIGDPYRPTNPIPPETIGLGGLGEIGAPFGVTNNTGTGVGSPSLRAGNVQVNGRLPPEVIQRVVRQNFGRFRLCYENALRKDPKVAGRVTVKFVIGADGEVKTASDGGSTMPDTTMVACVVRGFGNLAFPQPEGGIVTAVYPIDFTPAK